ncbi:uncharacterized lipoprotein YehR (DUF1307 family) [Breznakia sp. PF5-3]|uniref:DUF1307 domain-containing protein n=1 Tax=unclassified Breznakia TaxID=2623764 RepID=UPI0024076AFD|nr:MULTISPECIES: DUF1307 domain-containing protein [unclassified Breznakia]MDF9825055.1 uncharacterized lipoprotein YehR (DUF1307 family) [Breznakia sp. PM6-1]MDF9835902.1 uncharacterized lipoprotein YehR (DUF1307 family) [Breznakia sp. PF5-3]MDF9837363.1 uncharacterized lipoprotein YehR (DUF1307 family) [Breznakia sp. PFB2-8]MDF9859298.1 uncharacterized lipoprotein YehR (DUF1307 family) [Breznakia sp. PH5-24]
MNKLKVLMASILFVSLVGCSGSSGKTLTCTMKDSNNKVELKYDDDVLKSITATQETDLSTYGMSDEETEKLAKEFAESLAEIKGYTYTYKVKDGKLSETTTLDYEKADFDELIKNNFLTEDDLKKDDDKKQYISFKTMKESIESSGYTCK